MSSYRSLISTAMLLIILAGGALPAHSAVLQLESVPAPGDGNTHHPALTGRLEDNAGMPLGGVLVELHNWNGEMISSTVTGTDGSFRFDGVVIGQYVLNGALGHDSFSEELNFNGSPVPLDVRLGEHSYIRRKEAAPTVGTPDRVSVNDLAATPDARKKLQKATEALKQNKLDKALKFADEALKKDIHWARAWLVRGWIHQQSQDFTAAQKDFQAAAQADPGSGEALAALGESYTRALQWSQAEFYLQRATTVAPSQWQGWFELSRLQLLQGKYAAAAGSAQRALEATPPAPAGCHYFLGTAQAAMGHFAEAAQQFRLFLGSNPPPSRAAADAAHKLQLIEARSGPAASQPAAPQH